MSVDDLVPDSIRDLVAYSAPHPPSIHIKLDANENPFPLPAQVAAALGEHLARVPIHRYPDPGAAELREVLAGEVGVTPDQIVVGNGSDEIIHLIAASHARPRPGETRARVAFPWPSFVYYRIACAVQALEPLELPLRADFTMDVDAVETRLRSAPPNVAFFALPNNPTGTLWPMPAIADLAARHRDVLFVSDEAYFDYTGETLLPRLGDNLVVMRTLSKMGLAGLRVGYLVAPRSLAQLIERIRPPYNVGALNQTAAAWLLSHHRPLLAQRCRQIVAERDRLAALLARLPLEVFPSRANLLLVRHPDATRIFGALAGRGILVRNFDRPGPLAGCLRITVGTREENDALVTALTQISSVER